MKRFLSWYWKWCDNSDVVKKCRCRWVNGQFDNEKYYTCKFCKKCLATYNHAIKRMREIHK